MDVNKQLFTHKEQCQVVPVMCLICNKSFALQMGIKTALSHSLL